jgi:hypothetical protein
MDGTLKQEIMYRGINFFEAHVDIKKAAPPKMMTLLIRS